jgi:hypothetical protein
MILSSAGSLRAGLSIVHPREKSPVRPKPVPRTPDKKRGKMRTLKGKIKTGSASLCSSFYFCFNSGISRF